MTKFTKGLQWYNYEPVEPAILVITDLHSHSRHSSAEKVINSSAHCYCGPQDFLVSPQVLATLHRHGLQTALTSPFVYSALGLDDFDMLVPNFEFLYRTKAERKEKGLPGVVSSNFFGLKTSKVFEELYFHHNVFGKIID
jgi:hypothetical protein